MEAVDLSARHVFIAGGSRGIGAEAAKTAARAGARVSLTYRERSDAADAVVAEILDAGGEAVALRGDVTDEASITDAIEQAVTRFGPLRGLVISAGIFELSPLADMTLEFWKRIIDTNLTGTFLTLKAAAPHLRTGAADGAGASVVIYTSTSGQSGGAGASAYSTTKGGQILFMKSMAQELAPDRIRVNCVAPAWTDTDMAAAAIERMGREQMASRFPLGRIGDGRDVANATVFLLSDLASFSTGTTVTVDGGIAMRG